jgi:hypothetical protein
MAMVKTYNTNGLMEKNYSLETELVAMREDRLKMMHEITMLGLQRDEWEQRYVHTQ